MSGNTFGTIFRITTWGESHGPAMGVVVDGCPAGMALAAEDIQRAGPQASRSELRYGPAGSGLGGDPLGISRATTGAHLLLVWNKDADSSSYDLLRQPRPGHADYAYQIVRPA